MRWQGCVVAQGAARSMKAGLDMQRIADFVHGPDGFGGIGLPPPKVTAAGPPQGGQRGALCKQGAHVAPYTPIQ